MKSQNLEGNKVIIIIIIIIIIILLPHLPHHLVVQFYLWSKFYFLLFQTHHTLPYPKTYLPWQHGKLPVKESRDANLGCRFWRLSIFHFPPPPLSTAPLPPPPLLHPAPKLTQPPKGIMWSLTWSKCYQNPPLLDPNTYTCTTNYCWKQLQTHSAPNWVTQEI